MMQLASMLRYAAVAVLGGVTAVVLVTAPEAQSQPSFLQNGEAGFVVATVDYALSEDASATGACPNGLTSNTAYQAQINGQLQASENVSQEERQRRFTEFITSNIETNPCMHPEANAADPNFRTVEARDARAYGIDLDGQDSRADGPAAEGQCAQNDLRGMHGERGIDNQFFRVVGCSPSFQSAGQSNGWGAEMQTGAWGVLITLKGVDDVRNDDEVEVGFYANADPMEVSAAREPLWNATYAMSQDPRMRVTTRGRISNGVLTTEPTTIRFWKITNALWLVRELREARVRMTLSADGVLDGILAGYTPVESMYDLQFGMRNGTDRAGELAPLQRRMVTAMGAATVLGYTCNGAYHALLAAADGGRDPATGRCTTISTQYRVRAVPAFVVDVPTESVNEELGAHETDETP
jgi:hypothetical protein